MPPPLTLADLADSTETKIARAVAAVIRGGSFYGRDGQQRSDSFFADVFKPILLLESPTERRMYDFAQGTLAVIPGVAIQDGKQSDRIVLKVPIFIVAYLPFENTNEDSACRASNLCGRLRNLLWDSQSLVWDSETVSDATIEFAWVDARVSSGTLMATYRANYQTDLEPTSENLI